MNSIRIYVFPRRKTLHRLLTRLKKLEIPFRTYPDDIADGWVKSVIYDPVFGRRVERKKVYCVIVEGDRRLLNDLREFGRVRFEPLTPTP